MDGKSLMSPTAPSQGYVYVLSSPVLRTPEGYSLLKIGATRKHPLRRAAELFNGPGVPAEFELEYYLSFDDSFQAESAVHTALTDVRYNKSREFFCISVGDAVALIHSIANSSDDLVSNGESGGRYQYGGAGMPDLSFAELFHSFPDRGDGVLNAQEQTQCRALEAHRR